MKPFKVLLLLAVFCLTVSGSNYDDKSKVEDLLEINKDDFEISSGLEKKKKSIRPGGMG